MSRIPVVDQAIGSSFTPGVRGAPVPMIDNTGRALSQLGEAGLEVVDALNKRDQDNAKAWASKSLSDSELKSRGTLDSIQNQAPPSGEGVYPQFLKAYDAQTADLLKAAPNDQARKIASEHRNTLRTRLGSEAMNFEARQGVAYRSQQFLQGIDNTSNLILANPSPENYLEQVQAQRNLISESAMHPTEKTKLLNSLVDSSTTAYWSGMIKRNPVEAAAILRGSVEPSQATETITEDQFPKTGHAVLDATPFRIRLQMLTAAETASHQQAAAFRSSLEQAVKDQTVQAMTTGRVGQPLTRTAFVQAYGETEGTRRFQDEYVPMLKLGAAVSRTYGMTDAQQDQMLASLKPVSDVPGFAAAQHRYEVYAQAINQVRQQRQKDPIAFGISQNLGGLRPLDMSSPDAMADGLAARVAPAKALQSTFNTGDLKLLSAPEADAMKRAFQVMPTGQQGDYLAAMRSRVNDGPAFRAIVQQIAPDSPETQVAAGLINQAGATVTNTHWFGPDEQVTAKQTANWILAGRRLINPTAADQKDDGKSRGWSMPKDSDFRLEFNNLVGNAFAGNPKAYLDTYEAARAYYAGKTAFMGKADNQLNVDRTVLGEAIKAITGGVTDFGGSKVLMPWGMPESKFQQLVQDRAKPTFEAYGVTGNLANINAYRLMGAGDGRYYLLNGTEPLRSPSSGEKVILDLNPTPPTAGSVPSAPVVPIMKAGKASGGRLVKQ